LLFGFLIRGVFLKPHLKKLLAMSPLIVDLTRSSFFTFFEKKVKPKNFKYYIIPLFNK